MNVCIFTSVDLIYLINQMINQNNVNIQAVFVDDRVIAAEKIYPKERVFAYWQLREVVQQLQPDYILMMTQFTAMEFIRKECKEIDYPIKKIICLTSYLTTEAVELYGKLKHFEQNSNQYQMFVTGLSYAYFGIDESLFDLPTISFSFPSQDLYYDYEIVKKILPPPVNMTSYSMPI